MTVEVPARGRPRSDAARRAVLHAVDDILVEQGYAAMTMRGIAERAGVGRQTVYRWWATKAEILLEAVVEDAGQALGGARACRDPRKDLVTYLGFVGRFLTEEPAGLAYRALLGEAQHDPAVRELLTSAMVLSPSAHAVLERHRAACPSMPALPLATDQLLGPVLTRVLLGRGALSGRELGTDVDCLLRAWGARPADG